MSTKSSGGYGTVKVRVMADSSAVEGVAESIISSLGERERLKVVDCSRPYPRRPPDQEKSRIYLMYCKLVNSMCRASSMASSWIRGS